MKNDHLIEFCHVSKLYPGVCALNDVSFKISKEKIHGFLGPNGAGKSTAMNILAGLIPPSSGDVLVNGESIIDKPSWVRDNIGFLPENLPLYEGMSVLKFLEFVFDINSFRLNRDFNKQFQLQDVLDKCGLHSVKNKTIGNLSKGFKQRVGIAQAIVFDPNIIILDEPTNGLDPDAIREIRKLIKDLGRERTVLLSSHILSEMELMCDEVTIIRSGEIATSGTLKQIQSTFNSERKVLVKVLSWSEDNKKDLRELFRVKSIDQAKDEDGILLNIHFELNANVSESLSLFKASLSEFLVEKKCGLIYFDEKVVHLEEIFYSLADKQLKNQGFSADSDNARL